METKIRSKMRKDYFSMLVAAAAMLAACSSNDSFKEINNENVMIGFETYHEKSTKANGEIKQASDLTSANNGFGVWGYKYETAITPSGDPVTVNVSSTSTYTEIFRNVKVWYDSEISTSQSHAHFTYLVPKYWDKGMNYIFFAYAPYDASNAALDNTTGKITISAIPAIQDISADNGKTGAALVYSGTEGEDVKDYLMANYEYNQKYNATNQSEKDYTDKAQTVGFTFGHMLSKLQVNLQANSAYSGVKELIVNSFSIQNLPASNATTTSFTQVSPTAPAGIYSTTRYTSTLNIIGSTPTTSSSALYVLKGGVAKKANGDPTTTISEIASVDPPTPQPQQFHYYIAPNDPDDPTTTTGDDHVERYIVNLNYTINYVDNLTETVNISNIKLDVLPKLEQNNSYILTVKIAMNEILFTAETVTGWDPKVSGVTTPVEQIVVVGN